MTKHYRGWRKSVQSNSSSTDCVEVAVAHDDPGSIGVRDSKNKTGPILEFGRSEWSRFIANIKGGAHDLT